MLISDNPKMSILLQAIASRRRPFLACDTSFGRPLMLRVAIRSVLGLVACSMGSPHDSESDGARSLCIVVVSASSSKQ